MKLKYLIPLLLSVLVGCNSEPPAYYLPPSVTPPNTPVTQPPGSPPVVAPTPVNPIALSGRVTAVYVGTSVPEYADFTFQLDAPAPANAVVYLMYGNAKLSAPYDIPAGSLTGKIQVMSQFFLDAVYGEGTYVRLSGQGDAALMSAIQNLDIQVQNKQVPALKVGLTVNPNARLLRYL